MMTKMSRDERIVRALLGVKRDSIPERLLLVSTSFILDRAKSLISKTKVMGRVTTGEFEKGRVGIVDLGMGTPSAAMMMEAIVRTEAQVLLRADFCGGLMKNQSVGEAFIAEKAIVGDGSGVAYFGTGTIVEAHIGLTEHIKGIVSKMDLSQHTGTIWTTDVLMKQTKELLEDWVRKGASAVDMESTAILGIAGDEGVPAASLNCISDLPLHGPGPFDSETVDPNLLTGTERVVQAGLRALVEWES
ncbi:MAG: phosphorylase family protein [Candidatus Thorarchaeota archaeon]